MIIRSILTIAVLGTFVFGAAQAAPITALSSEVAQTR